MDIFQSSRVTKLTRGMAVLLCAGLCLGAGGCSSHKKKSRHKEHHIEVSHSSRLSKWQRHILDEASTWLGTPYIYAGSQKGVGTDCSGMVMEVYRTVDGRKLPRNSAKQAEFCHRLKEKDVRPGDLVFFATGHDPDRISHVGIMMEEGNFIHASSSKGVVISRVDAPYYVRTFKMYGRVPD